MEKTIKINEVDYKVVKAYSKKNHIPIRWIINKALKRYFGKRFDSLKE